MHSPPAQSLDGHADVLVWQRIHHLITVFPPTAAFVMNSTRTDSDALLGAPGTSMTGLARLRPELELLWVLLSYSPFLAKALRYASPKVARARLYPHAPLVVHILSGPMLVLRYHARYAAQRVWPRPTAADLLLFAAFSLTSFLLEAHRSRAPHATPVVRTGFQAAVLVQAVLFGASWARGGDPVLFRAAVKFMNWFASFRATAGLLGLVDPRLAAPGGFAARMEVTMVVSGCFAAWEAGVPAGVPVFLGLVAVLMVAERAVAETVWSIPDGNPLKRLVLASGYVDHNLLRLKASQATEAKAG